MKPEQRALLAVVQAHPEIAEGIRRWERLASRTGDNLRELHEITHGIGWHLLHAVRDAQEAEKHAHPLMVATQAPPFAEQADVWTARELRALGVPIDDGVPDDAWLPRNALAFEPKTGTRSKAGLRYVVHVVVRDERWRPRGER